MDPHSDPHINQSPSPALETSAPQDAETDHAASTQRPRVEIGWILAGQLDPVDLKAVHQAHQATLSYLKDKLPEFEWEMPLLRRDELVTSLHVEPVVLLDNARAERNTGHWDATVLITAADLVSRYKSAALAVLSRSLEATIVSTRRIDPRRNDATAKDKERLEAMKLRLRTLILHALGRLWGLSTVDHEDNWMHPTGDVSELDPCKKWSDEQLELLRKSLYQVADVRLEEKSSRWQPLLFYMSSSWINRGQIFQAIKNAEPWKFPFRLSRLTATSISAMVILLVTAEVWELGMIQPIVGVVLFSLCTIVATTWYVLVRQGLLLRRRRENLTEQNVVTNVCTVCIVTAGITTTYLLLFALTFTIGITVFDNLLLRDWLGDLQKSVSWGHYAIVAGFVSTLGIIVGTLGASFEGNYYFRHVTFVDEEL